MSQGNEPLDIQPAGPKLITKTIGELEVIEVQRVELDRLRESSDEENRTTGFLGTLVGILSTVVVTLLASPPSDPYVYASFLVSIPAGVVLGVYFFLRRRVAHKTAGTRYDAILNRANLRSERSIGPRLISKS